jgi:hypothetical protein
MWRIGWAPNSIPIYIQQDTTLHSLFIPGNCFTCFGWYFHSSSGAHTTVSTGSGICQTVTAICRDRGRVGTGLSVLWVVYVVLYLHPSRCFRDVGNGKLYLHSYFKCFAHKLKIPLKIPYRRDPQAIFITQCGICSQSHSHRILQLITLTATQTSVKVMFRPPPSRHFTFH